MRNVCRARAGPDEDLTISYLDLRGGCRPSASVRGLRLCSHLCKWGHTQAGRQGGRTRGCIAGQRVPSLGAQVSQTQSLGCHWYWRWPLQLPPEKLKGGRAQCCCTRNPLPPAGRACSGHVRPAFLLVGEGEPALRCAAWPGRDTRRQRDCIERATLPLHSRRCSSLSLPGPGRWRTPRGGCPPVRRWALQPCRAPCGMFVTRLSCAQVRAREFGTGVGVGERGGWSLPRLGACPPRPVSGAVHLPVELTTVRGAAGSVRLCVAC